MHLVGFHYKNYIGHLFYVCVKSCILAENLTNVYWQESSYIRGVATNWTLSSLLFNRYLETVFRGVQRRNRLRLCRRQRKPRTLFLFSCKSFFSKQSPKVWTTDQKQPANQEYFSYLGSMITNDARCTSEIKSRIVMAIAPFNKEKTIFTSKWCLYFKETFGAQHCMELKLRHFRK